MFFDQLREAPEPLFVFEDCTIPGASVWTGSRHWVEAFRQRNLEAGERLVVDLPPGPTFLQVLVAGFWEGLSLVIAPESGFDLLGKLDARGVVSTDSHPSGWLAKGVSGPGREPDSLRPAEHEPTPEARLFLRSSGSRGDPEWYGLSERNLRSVVESHHEVLEQADTVLSHLPWHHCFGLVLELLLAIRRSQTLVRDPSGGRDLDKLEDLRQSYEARHFNTVPLMVERLAEHIGRDFFEPFEEGLVGGAPINDRTAEVLEGTDLRVGYGQTEASPGITLGEPGVFKPNYLGHPVGCRVEQTEQQELVFEGMNAYRIKAQPESLAPFERKKVPRAVHTGDLVRRSSDGWVFQGRVDDQVKLPNGRFVHPVELEDTLSDTFPGQDPFVGPMKTGSLAVGCRSSGEPPSLAEVQRALGELGAYVSDVFELSDENLERNHKGEVDRRATVRNLTS